MNFWAKLADAVRDRGATRSGDKKDGGLVPAPGKNVRTSSSAATVKKPAPREEKSTRTTSIRAFPTTSSTIPEKRNRRLERAPTAVGEFWEQAGRSRGASSMGDGEDVPGLAVVQDTYGELASLLRLHGLGEEAAKIMAREKIKLMELSEKAAKRRLREEHGEAEWARRLGNLEKTLSDLLKIISYARVLMTSRGSRERYRTAARSVGGESVAEDSVGGGIHPVSFWGEIISSSRRGCLIMSQEDDI